MLDQISKYLTLIKESLLLIFFILPFAAPSWVHSVLTNAGISEISAGGVTYKEQAAQAQKIADSSQKIAAVATNHLDSIKKLFDPNSLALIKATGATDKEIDSLSKKYDKLNTTSQNLHSQIQVQQQKLKKLFPAGAE
jgi:hypothetical protein